MKTNLLLASLQAADVGLNITCANVAFMMEPDWNPTVKAQAFDRLHQIGQQKPVQVLLFVTPDTVEQKNSLCELADLQIPEIIEENYYKPCYTSNILKRDA
ncbi:hypothetical protein MJO28_011514 [Puccinia striiformis f. sp. tritici]|uniref:Uncharacterized protein n=1 Tax=Puccinia striiformis f. sp. tritici TaxID=168172 RepID=A0ACC0E3Q0_9BASI|nr:hypothetical protein MJO28_011514 [Puccinia striiformis f. sp. tritici]